MAVPPGVLLTLYIFVWASRFFDDPTNGTTDVVWSLLFLGWSLRRQLHFFIYLYFSQSSWHLVTSRSLISICLGLPSIVALNYFLTLRIRQKRTLNVQETESHDGSRDSRGSFFGMKPLVFPSRIHHTRQFPKNHSFAYSYLMVGIPVGWRGSAGTFLSADLKSLPPTGKKPSLAWLNVASADHLARGDHPDGLRGKLEAYLRSMDEDPQHFPYAYLITAPTIFGYSFNPASFWYLYNSRGGLKAMIVEVNNTFDERRLYFLHNDANQESKNWSNFKTQWPKDFHVSPFNSRKGSYSISARDPWASISQGCQYKTNIQLYSSKSHLKIVASAASTESGLDPSTFGRMHIVVFLLSWWWVGLMTFPRILKEAARLFFRRKLHVWFRPEVLKDSIGRQATREESSIEGLFLEFLQHKVESSSLNCSVIYTSCTNTGPVEHTLRSTTGKHPIRDRTETKSTECESCFTTITLKVTSPEFYADLARCTDLRESITKQTDLQNTTIFVSDKSVALEILTPPTESCQKAVSSSLQNLPMIARIQWKLIGILRREMRLSEMDFYAIELAASSSSSSSSSSSFSNETKSAAYRRATLKLLLSKYLTYGVPELLDLAVWTLRIFLYIIQIRALISFLPEAFLLHPLSTFTPANSPPAPFPPSIHPNASHTIDHRLISLTTHGAITWTLAINLFGIHILRFLEKIS